MGVEARFAMVTREGCHLCEVMAGVLDEVLPGLGERWVPLDVDADPELFERWSDTVPVLLRDGKPVAKVRVDRRRLRRLVRGRR